MSAMSRSELWERRSAGRNPPLCPCCGHGNLAGRWEGPLGWYDEWNDRTRSMVERGEWTWECDNCGESGPWVPSNAWKADPFMQGTALHSFERDRAAPVRGDG